MCTHMLFVCTTSHKKRACTENFIEQELYNVYACVPTWHSRAGVEAARSHEALGRAGSRQGLWRAGRLMGGNVGPQRPPSLTVAGGFPRTLHSTGGLLRQAHMLTGQQALEKNMKNTEMIRA